MEVKPNLLRLADVLCFVHGLSGKKTVESGHDEKKQRQKALRTGAGHCDPGLRPADLHRYLNIQKLAQQP